MATITAGAVTPVGGAFATTPAASGSFIPTLWSARLNAKFYAASTFADICNHDWEGEISGLGDKVIIQNPPDINIEDYTVGGNLTYQVPTPSTVELQIDRAKRYGFAVSDVLAHQSKPSLMDMFTNDAAEQMRVVMDSTCLYRTFNQGAAANAGATAGTKSGSFNLGTDTAPIVINSASAAAIALALQKILELASVLDEQNVPDSGRWVVIDPFFRTVLMQSNLSQAQFMGDDKSMVRNGLIGTIDRFKVYVSNQLPTKAAGATVWTSGDGSETSTAGSAYATYRTRAVLAGHTSAISFASQMTKTETLRNPTDFGDVVRGLNVFGHKVTKDSALALLKYANG
jgi:hypothetical protein